MKYLVLLAVLVVIYTLWKHQRAQERAEKTGQRPAAGADRTSPPPGPTTQEMVRCPVCHLHLPQADAVPDVQGRLFCSPAHRDQANA